MNKSFTLIEILIVIVVIGVLSAFILVGMSSITNSANITKGKAFSDSLRSSLLIDLVSEWKLDEGVGGTTKDSWGVSGGTLSGTPTWTDSNCISGNCLDFDGVDDYIDVGNDNSVRITDFITIEYWSYTQGSSSNGYCSETVSKRGCYDICCNDLFSTVDGHNDVALVDGLVPSLNVWYHVVYTYDSNARIGKFYRDSKLLNTRDVGSIYPGYATYKMGSSCGNLYISNSIYRFNGILDEIKIYKQVLAGIKIRENYYIGLNKLFKNKNIALEEFNERVSKLKSNLANNE